MTSQNVYLNLIKPVGDRLVALLLLIVLLPLLILLSLLIAMMANGKLIFEQKRIGLQAKPFSIYKFKTIDEDSQQSIRFGGFFRKLSLDELPQLVNVLKGDMSIVGPRPLLPEYLNYYSNDEMNRHAVKPGITGLAQINGRNSSAWETRMKFDVYYVEQVGFWLDCKILVKTMLQLFKFKEADFEMQEMESFTEYAKRR